MGRFLRALKITGAIFGVGAVFSVAVVVAMNAVGPWGLVGLCALLVFGIMWLVGEDA